MVWKDQEKILVFRYLMEHHVIKIILKEGEVDLPSPSTDEDQSYILMKKSHLTEQVCYIFLII